ncbi:hypothetical protein SLOPH_905 [Spraguea lophii 42_110]|uniref:Spore wall protein n=1 Tax=Spraguea lophii (strain 42_110) TaxID=1358809 RepID=S7W888_SPRLO|nr:hypothetical protein SLOPH_905 [Spraguea lophii 42_110]
MNSLYCYIFILSSMFITIHTLSAKDAYKLKNNNVRSNMNIKKLNPYTQRNVLNKPTPNKNMQMSHGMYAKSLISPRTHIDPPNLDSLLIILRNGEKTISDSIPGNINTALNTIKDLINATMDSLKTFIKNEIDTGNAAIETELTTILNTPSPAPPGPTVQPDPLTPTKDDQSDKDQKLAKEINELNIETKNEVDGIVKQTRKELKDEVMNLLNPEEEEIKEDGNSRGHINLRETASKVKNHMKGNNNILYSKINDTITKAYEKSNQIKHDIFGDDEMVYAAITPYKYDPSVIMPLVRTALDTVTNDEITNITAEVDTAMADLETQVMAVLDTLNDTFAPVVEQVTLSEIASMGNALEDRNNAILNQALTIVSTP